MALLACALTSLPPAFLPLCRWDVFCLHSPGSANTDPRQGQHLYMLCQQRQVLGQTHRGQPHVEAAQDQWRAAGQRLLISAPWRTENHKSSAPGRVVILPHVSPKQQHDTCQDVKSTAFDALQQLGNENKQNASTGKLGHWKTSVEICWGFISPSFFFKGIEWHQFPWLRWGVGPLQGCTLRCLSYFGCSTHILMKAIYKTMAE